MDNKEEWNRVCLFVKFLAEKQQTKIKNEEEGHGQGKNTCSSLYNGFLLHSFQKENTGYHPGGYELHARENGYRLEWDAEARDYIGMTRRFCDIEEIYAHTKSGFL